MPARAPPAAAAPPCLPAGAQPAPRRAAGSPGARGRRRPSGPALRGAARGMRHRRGLRRAPHRSPHAEGRARAPRQVRDGEDFPADLVCLHCAKEDNVCYVKTTNLDGAAPMR